MENDRLKLAGKKVVVGLTGRIDSALAAFLLKKQGMQVIGLTIVTTDEETVGKASLPKCHVQDLEKVKSLCAHLDIPFYATNAKPRFESEVLDVLTGNKLVGKANSSCFNCSLLRMETLYDKMVALDADFIATGHYAKVRMNLNSKKYFIHSSGHEESDQSFLLAGTPGHILERLLLPLGELGRKEVLKYASHFALPLAPSIEQVGFCFRRPASVVSKRIPKGLLKTGPIENIENGTSLGEHDGIIKHYIGEKEPAFKDSNHIDKKLEIVGYKYKSATILMGHRERLSFEGAQLVRTQLSKGVNQGAPLACFVKFKYSEKFIKSNLYFKNNDSLFLQFFEDVYPLIPGEVIVIYDSNGTNSKILGYGMVGKRGGFKLLNRVENFERKKDLQDEDAPKEAPTPYKF